MRMKVPSYFEHIRKATQSLRQRYLVCNKQVIALPFELLVGFLLKNYDDITRFQSRLLHNNC